MINKGAWEEMKEKQRIRVRDQLKNPTFLEARALLEKLSEVGGPHFMILFDVAKAHRMIPVREEDWPLPSPPLLGRLYSCFAILQVRSDMWTRA